MSFTEKELWALRTRLTSFARTLSPHDHEDLVQDALVRAWFARDSFTPGTNLIGWVSTILRNVFFSRFRKKKREVELPEDDSIERLSRISPSQEDAVYLREILEYLEYLPVEQQRALLRTHLNGYSYEETARMESAAVGTIKSRVNRALAKLKELLEDTDLERGRIRLAKRPVRLKKIAEPPQVVVTYPVRNLTSQEIAREVVPVAIRPVQVPLVIEVASMVTERLKRERPMSIPVRSIYLSPITTEVIYGNSRIRSTVLRRTQ